MQCPSCGTEIQPEDTKCPSCGAATTPTSSAPTSFEPSDTIPYGSEVEAIPYIASSSLTESSPASPASPPDDTASSTSGPQEEADSSAPAEEAQQATAERPIQRPAMLRSTAILLVVLAVLLVTGGGGFTAYATIFHSLELHAQATAVTQHILAAEAQATAASNANSPQNAYNRITTKIPSLSDPLDGLHSSSWSKQGKGETGCSFTNGAYHVRVSPQDFYSYCLAAGHSYNNFLFQVQMTIIKGLEGGIVFRTADPSFASYFFTITYNGLYALNVAFDIQHGTTLAFGRSSAINTGLNQVNLIGVLAVKGNISLFINRQFVATVDDDTHPSGAIGLLTSNIPRTSIDVAFNNVQVWNLP